MGELDNIEPLNNELVNSEPANNGIDFTSTTFNEYLTAWLVWVAFTSRHALTCTGPAMYSSHSISLLARSIDKQTNVTCFSIPGVPKEHVRGSQLWGWVG